MTTWYVDSAVGSDANSGKAPGEAFLTLSHIISVTNPGDTAIIMPGNGYGGGVGGSNFFYIGRSGSAGLPITYKNYPGTRPLIKSAQSNAAIYIQANYITVQGLELAGHNDSLDYFTVIADFWAGNGLITLKSISQGIIADTSHHHITISNNIIHDFPGNGISFANIDYGTISGNTVYNNAKYSGYANSGISVFSFVNFDSTTVSKISVTGNTIYNNNNLVPNETNDPLHAMTANGAASAGASTITLVSVTGLTTGMCVWDAQSSGAFAAITPGTYITNITGNVITLSATINAPGVGATDHILIGNISDGEGIIIDTNAGVTGRTTVQNNLCFDNGGTGINIVGSSKCDVSYNTCYLNQKGFQQRLAGSGGEISSLFGTSNNFVANNIMLASASHPRATDNGTSTTWSFNNAFGGDGTALPGSSNIVSDPLFVSPSTDPTVCNFNIQSTSPAIGAATSSFTVSTDIRGQTRPIATTYDCGAYENQGTVIAGVSTIRTPTFLLQSDFQDGQAAGSIVPVRIRDLIASLWSGRSQNW